MNSSSIHWRRNASALCAELGPEDGIDPRVLARTRQESRSFCRKEQQLCKEVARLLSLILAGDTANPLLHGLQVVRIESEDSGRQLCVTLGHPQPVASTEADILAALASARGHWRTALAPAYASTAVPVSRSARRGVAMPIQQIMTKGRVPVKIYTDEVETAAMQQLYNLSQLPFVHNHIAVMPDVHAGIGATVGSVIPTHRAIIPAAVGVDIGCGMNALRLSLKASDLPDTLRSLRLAIEAAIPVRFDMHKQDRARESTIRGLSHGLQWLAQLSVSAAALKCGVRDRWIGWDFRLQ